MGVNQITEQLHIADAQSVRRLSDDHEFDEIVTLGYFGEFGYGLPEHSTTGDTYVFPDGPHDYNTFKQAVEYILDALADEKNVLVHCQAGVSRSGGVCAVVLSERESMSLLQALTIVQDARDIVDPGEPIRKSMRRYTDQALPEHDRFPR